MVINWRLYLTVAAITSALLIGGYLGYTNGPGKTTVLPMVITKKEVEEKEKIVYRDRVVNKTTTVEKKPDGSVKEVIVEKSEEKEQSREESVTRKEEVVSVKPNLKNYSLGIGLVRHWDRDFLDRKIVPEYSAGYRLIGPVWLKVSTVPADKSYTLGIEYQF